MTWIRKPGALVLVAFSLVALFLVAALYFQPWRLITNTTVSESIPGSAALSEADAAPPKASNKDSSALENSATDQDVEAAQQFPIVLSEGTFISHEYQTTGTVRILELENGQRLLRIEGLDTSDGPELEVWITDAPVIEGLDGWRVFDDGNYLSLGPLKGNLGDQNYEIPVGLDLSDFSSVSIWCVRFSVSFGAAELNLT